MSVNMLGYDATFELNEFGEPKLCSEVELLKNVILFILFTTPGQYPSLPTIGMDIENLLYSFYDELDTDKIKNQIIEQCDALGMFFQNSTISVKKLVYKKQPSLLIHIEGRVSYPPSYHKDKVDDVEKYMVGITFDEMNRLLYNINEG